MATRTYIFTGGGTGGHLFPGIAVARELKQRQPDCSVLFVGSERELEKAILQQQGFEHCPLPVEPFRTLKRNPWTFARRNWLAWRQARRLIRDRQPAAVIGLGGYASGPLVLAAARLGTPVVLLEQNAIPGRVTRWLARSASVVCSSYEEATAWLPRKARVVVTGNPVRTEIAALHGVTSSIDSQARQLLVLGGSQGADSLNDAVVAAVKLLRDDVRGWKIVHQAGARQLESIRAAYQTLGIEACVEPFFEDMVARYQAAALVVSRAGATTLAELTCCGLPMILLPYPHAADDHQRANAQSLATHGAAVVVEHASNGDETGRTLAVQLQRLMADVDARGAMSLAAKRLAVPRAAEAVMAQILSLSHR